MQKNLQKTRKNTGNILLRQWACNSREENENTMMIKLLRVLLILLLLDVNNHDRLTDGDG